MLEARLICDVRQHWTQVRIWMLSKLALGAWWAFVELIQARALYLRASKQTWGGKKPWVLTYNCRLTYTYETFDEGEE